MDVYHFGQSKDEIAAYRKQYQSEYYGNTHDARFEMIDDKGTLYYAIFRSPAEDEWIIKKSIDYLLFKDQNRVLLNVAGKLYRYLIKERKLLSDTGHAGIICNDIGQSLSPYFHSISSPIDEVMVIVDYEGIAAINWDTVIWKHAFEGADCGHLELLSINNDRIEAKYENYFEGKIYFILFDLHTGKYVIKPFKNI